MPRLSWKYVLYCLPLFFGVFKCQNAEREIDICAEQTGTIARLVHLTNPRFPRSEVTNSSCQCNISGTSTISTDLWVSAGMGPVPVTLQYEPSQPGISWPHGPHNMSDGRNNYMIIARNVTVLHVVMDTYSTDYSVLIFSLDIAAVDVVNVTCWVTQHNWTTDVADGTSPNSIMKYFANLCSPQLLIILASLSLILFLITLPLGIVVCCLAPRRCQKYEVEMRKKNSDTHTGLLYDDAVIKMCSSGDYTSPSNRRPSHERRANWRRSNSVPGRYAARQSGPHYANTDGMATTPI